MTQPYGSDLRDDATRVVVAAVFRERTQWTKLAMVGTPVVAATLAVGGVQLP